MLSRLAELCRARTALGEGDLVRLEDVARQLPTIAALTDADIFIDCPLDGSTAIVVAQARPHLGISAYSQDVVGELATVGREPAVFRAFEMGLPVCDLKAITQEGRAVRQNVAPIFGEDGGVMAVIIREKDISADLRRGRKYEALARTYEEGDPSLRAAEPELDENTAAMREVHHRIKNNLQLIASILDLQSRKSEDLNVKKILQENLGRILSIASIHDILAAEADREMVVDGRKLAAKLRASLQALAPASMELTFTVTGGELYMYSDVATSVALVTTELVTNAFQHAFEGRSSGTVAVSFCAGTLYHTVTVSDDGRGFDPAGVREGSFGFSIVRATVRDKLRGRLRVASGSGGTKVSFDFTSA